MTNLKRVRMAGDTPSLSVRLQNGQRGSRTAPLREELLSILWRERRPLTAYDLIAELQKEDGRKLGPPTVYRALEFLVSERLIARIESCNAYMCRANPESLNEAVFLLCDSCGSTQEIDSRALEHAVEDDARRLGFQISRHVLELHGLCSQCRPGSAANSLPRAAS